MSERVRTDVDFVAGFDPVGPIPEPVRSAGLQHRVAVIQHTGRADTPDMYFDEELWRSLLQFVRDLDPGLEVRVGPNEATSDAFLDEWTRLPERYPPEFIVAKDRGQLVLYIATEYWNQVGGPAPYADSYTYSIFSKEDVTSRLIEFLRTADASDRWTLSAQVTPANTQMRKY